MLMLPVTLRLGLINVNAVIDTLVASRLIDPARACGDQRRVPPLHAAAGDVLRRRRDGALPGARAARGAQRPRGVPRDHHHRPPPDRLSPHPASVVSAVLAEPIVRIVYERGAFNESDVTVVAGCLAAFSLGLVFNGWMLMLTRGFYGLQSNWLPTLIAVGTLS